MVVVFSGQQHITLKSEWSFIYSDVKQK